MPSSNARMPIGNSSLSLVLSGGDRSGRRHDADGDAPGYGAAGRRPRGDVENATGDFSVVLPGLQRKDEIGDMANAVERVKVLADEKARAEATEAVKRQQTNPTVRRRLGAWKQKRRRKSPRSARGRPKSRCGPSRRSGSVREAIRRRPHIPPDRSISGSLQRAQGKLHNTMARLQETIRSLTESAREVTSASAEFSGSTTDLSQRTEKQAASLEETSASMEEYPPP